MSLRHSVVGRPSSVMNTQSSLEYLVCVVATCWSVPLLLILKTALAALSASSLHANPRSIVPLYTWGPCIGK